MNKTVKEKWIAALTNGEFKQTKGVLKSSTGQYCCLGVLCELYNRENPSVKIPSLNKIQSDNIGQQIIWY